MIIVWWNAVEIWQGVQDGAPLAARCFPPAERLIGSRSPSKRRWNLASPFTSQLGTTDRQSTKAQLQAQALRSLIRWCRRSLVQTIGSGLWFSLAEPIRDARPSKWDRTQALLHSSFGSTKQNDCNRSDPQTFWAFSLSSLCVWRWIFWTPVTSWWRRVRLLSSRQVVAHKEWEQKLLGRTLPPEQVGDHEQTIRWYWEIKGIRCFRGNQIYMYDWKHIEWVDANEILSQLFFVFCPERRLSSSGEWSRFALRYSALRSHGWQCFRRMW